MKRKQAYVLLNVEIDHDGCVGWDDMSRLIRESDGIEVILEDILSFRGVHNATVGVPASGAIHEGREYPITLNGESIA